MLSALRVLAIVLSAALVASCASGLSGSNLLDDKLERKSAPNLATSKRARLGKFLAENSGPEETDFAGFGRLGNDQLTGQPISSRIELADDEPRNLKLNLVGVPLAEAAKTVLGDIVGLNYSIDARVTGSVTLQTSKPITRRRLLVMFEAILRDNGAALVANGDNYRIVPASEAVRSVAAIDAGPVQPRRIGVRSQLVPLRFASAEEMRTLLGPIVPPEMVVEADARRNVLILSGSAEEIAAIRETISVFDVDWMRGMSFALIPLKSSRPEAIAGDLEQIFQTKKGPLKDILRIVPNKRLKSILLISSRARYLKEATGWIRKLDVLAESSERSLHVYHVQNRTASELAKVLQAVLRGEERAEAGIPARVAPKLEAGRTGVTPIPDEPTSGPETPLEGPGSNESYEAEASAEPVEGSLDPERGGQQIRVVADDADNSLLIFATQAEFERTLEILQEIDSIPNQVLLEAVIAEVTLDDDLRFGVRWLIGDESQGGKFSDVASGALSSVFPGFSYFLKANDISFTLNALASVTDVRVLSAPSLVVLDNRTARLQVGDEVPIVTQTAQGISSGDAPIVNNIELKETGVILSVTPRVNDSGRVTLEIVQEVSAVVPTTTSGIDSPTIRQRKINTSVVISDGEALALGGLIQERESTGKSKVPVLGDVPLLGNAFRRKTNSVSRTELIIFLRPRVIRDLAEARRITREFREQLGVKAPRVRRDEPTPGGELIRILN